MAICNEKLQFIKELWSLIIGVQMSPGDSVHMDCITVVRTSHCVSESSCTRIFEWWQRLGFHSGIESWYVLVNVNTCIRELFSVSLWIEMVKICKKNSIVRKHYCLKNFARIITIFVWHLDRSFFPSQRKKKAKLI